MTLRELAGEPYGPGGSALRVALVRAPEPGAVVAAHHGALDGLGWIALLSLVLGERVATSARGVTPSRPRRGVFGLFVLRRMAEALLWPPTRIAGHTSATAAPGEQLAQRLTPVFRGGVAALAAASARTVISWNGAHGEDAQRVVIAIGASRRSGAEPTLEHRAAWMRISAGSGSDDEVAAALRQAPPLPVGPASSRLAGPGRLAAALLSRRLGSTLLLSNLGAVSGPPELQELSFYPVTHGQRAVALGAATVGGRTTLTLRGEGRDFDAAVLQAILERLAEQLDPTV